MSMLNFEFMNMIRPLRIDKSIRLGSDYDGGYILPEVALSQIKYVFAYGYGYNFKFEEDLVNLKNAQIFLYDDEASTIRLLNQLILSLLIRPFRKSTKYAPKKIIKCLLDYYKLISTKKIAYRNFKVLPLGSNLWQKGKTIIFDDTIETVKFKHFEAGIKMDIEGHEYLIFDQAKVDFLKIAFIIIEFHGIGSNYSLFKRVIKKLQTNFVITNIHINNYGSISDIGIPSIVEISFVNKALIGEYSYADFIPSSLDRPCCIRKPEIRYQYKSKEESTAIL